MVRRNCGVFCSFGMSAAQLVKDFFVHSLGDDVAAAVFATALPESVSFIYSSFLCALR